MSVLLAAGVVAVRLRDDRAPLETIQVAVGSEDMAYLQDPQVQQQFASKGYAVEATGFGSGQLARQLSPKSYDAFLPSSQAFADEAQARLKQGSLNQPQPFSTPLAVFTWRPLLPLLHRLQIINSSGQFDIAQYLNVVSSRIRWNEIQGNTFYSNPGQILLHMTNPVDSDSGAMFVAAASYVLNGKQVISSDAQVSKTAPPIARALIPLGEMPETTNQIFTEYLRGRMAGMPLALGYESEFTGMQDASPRSIPPGAVMIPLATPIDCVHTIIPFDPRGREFATLMTSDPVLQQLAARRYGFLTTQQTQQQGYNISVPAVPLLKKLIQDVVPGGTGS